MHAYSAVMVVNLVWIPCLRVKEAQRKWYAAFNCYAKRDHKDKTNRAAGEKVKPQKTDPQLSKTIAPQRQCLMKIGLRKLVSLSTALQLNSPMCALFVLALYVSVISIGTSIAYAPKISATNTKKIKPSTK
jgi:hypothetical protein